MRRRCSEFVTPCGIPVRCTFQKANSFQVRRNISSRVKTQWFFPVQVRFFSTTAFLYLCSVSDIDHALSFYYICRYWWLQYRRIGLTCYSWYRLLQRPPSAPKGGLSPSRLVPSPVSFICSRFYMFGQNLYKFTCPLWTNQVDSQDSMRTGYQPAYRVEQQQEVRYQRSTSRSRNPRPKASVISLCWTRLLVGLRTNRCRKWPVDSSISQSGDAKTTSLQGTEINQAVSWNHTSGKLLDI